MAESATMSVADSAHREAIRTLVARSGRMLDRGDFSGYVELYAADGTYTMEAFSHEIGRNTVWMQANPSELVTLFKEAPMHIRDKARRTHLVTTDEIEVDGAAAKAVSTFAVFRTTLTGETTVYALGSYDDEIALDGGQWKLKSRRVTLTTRSLSVPTPEPL